MGCGCGKKVTRTNGSNVAPVVMPSNATPLQTAQTFQSANILKAPTGPVVDRKTV